MSEAGGQALPEEALEKTKQHILDTFAAMVSGSELAPGRFAIKFARAHSAEKVATVAASDVVCGAIEAAFANAMLAHSDETDDSHAPSESHPGASVVPSALAAGEQFNIDGSRFLRAVALGYDVGTRVTMTVGVGAISNCDPHQHARAGRHLRIGRRCRLRRRFERAADALADRLRVAASFRNQNLAARYGSHRKGVPVRRNARAQRRHGGVCWFKPAPPASTMSSRARTISSPITRRRPIPAKLIDKLGERYEVTRTNIKKWTVGSPIQAPLDALEIILKRRPFEADQVQTVTVRVATSEAALVSNREMPDICLQHMVAVMLLDKTASFKAAHDKPRMQDPAVLKQRAKSAARSRRRTRASAARSRGHRRGNAHRRDASHRNRESRPRHRRKSDAARRSDRQMRAI